MALTLLEEVEKTEEAVAALADSTEVEPTTVTADSLAVVVPSTTAVADPTEVAEPTAAMESTTADLATVEDPTAADSTAAAEDSMKAVD